jgi:sugar/nucleoside kinase (ribokinase family)
MNSVLIVGSIAYDDVKTPFGSVKNSLGGSTIYASLSASLFSKAHIVGIVGHDFKKEHVELLRSKNIQLEGLTHDSGLTFHWSGRYEKNMNIRHTLKTELNVFSKFHPTIPLEWKKISYVFLGNIQPEVQLDVLNQLESPKYIILDTMNLYIQSHRKALLKVLKYVNLVVVNDQEAILLTKANNLITAAEKIQLMGPDTVIIKKGEHGAILVNKKNVFVIPALLLKKVIDPTGAGDSFAGGLIGFLAQQGSYDWITLKKAMLIGTVMASFCVQDFSVQGLLKINHKSVHDRWLEFYKTSSFPHFKL